MIEKILVNQGLHVFIDAYLYHDIPISRYASGIYILPFYIFLRVS